MHLAESSAIVVSFGDLELERDGLVEFEYDDVFPGAAAAVSLLPLVVLLREDHADKLKN